ncbi:type II CRISPR RNA-guided endonuclease Cas9 [Bacillus cytotoxicus]|uniref:type II CRISPR RNA-guided endonuclease Cas9 n=1 Tax=Bacillus cytotoxicus TaxID=580165 RepID=UPI0035CC5B13
MKYSIGLDIGIASVGWAVINEDIERIEDLGVRIFDVAEQPKTGASLSTPRRLARSTRKRLRRRRHRVERVRKFMIQKGLLTQVQMEQLYDWKDGDLDIWLVRVNALERKLSDREFARILVHFAKNRGFQSNRKSELQEEDNGAVLSAVQENKRLMEEKGYQTISEMLLYDEKFEGTKRNKGGEYTHVVARSDLKREIQLIFEKQRAYGHAFATMENEDKFLQIWSSQRPFATKDDIAKKIGNCTFEPKEKRAPKSTYTFERFRALDKLNRLRILSGTSPARSLTQEERDLILNSLFSKKEVKYKELRKLLKLNDEQRFNEIFYDPNEKIEKNENRTFLSLESQYKIRKILQKIEGKSLNDTYRPVDLDTIAYALTVFKDDQDIRDYLQNQYVASNGKKELNLANRKYNDELIEELLHLSFTKFGHLSLKALRNILPFMEQGIPYHQACEKAGYQFNKKVNREKQKLLPPVPAKDIVNPVVIRSLSQVRKVINGIIKRYGSPSSIYIELAREMGREYKERKDLEKQYNKNRQMNEGAKKHILELHPEFGDPRGHDILKYKLWQEQDCRCAYSFKPIPIKQLFEIGYAEVDHIIPYSRSFDDSNNNKVLVLAAENQNKQNRTPYEWFGHDETKWQEFTSLVTTMKVSKKKKSLLLKKNFDEEQAEEFRSRHLNDTRYITRYIKTFIEDNLQFRMEEGKKQYVHTVNGAYTSLMRKRWGFNKNRQENDLHHALDAVIVAVSLPFKHKVSAYFKRREEYAHNQLKREGEFFPEPWSGFIHELEIRMMQDSENIKLAMESLNLKTYDESFIKELKPIFVSRMPKRAMKGQIHEETLKRVRGRTDDGYIRTVKKVKLDQIPFDKNGDFPMFGKETDMKTYEAIKSRYLESGKDKKKAFNTPLYKPAKNPENAPIIRSIKIEEKANRVVMLDEKTAADNASIVRTEVFRHKETGNYFLTPVYVADVLAKKVPDRLITPKKPYSEWRKITDEYEFLFSLYPNDLIRVKMPKEKETKTHTGEKHVWQENFMYFKGVHSGNAGVRMIDHMNSFEDEIGVRKLVVFEKYQVDPLGRMNKVHGEKRHGI